MQFLVLAAALELGYLPAGDFVMHEPPAWVDVSKSLYVDIEARVVLADVIFVGGSMKVFVWGLDGLYQFFPERGLYEFCAGVKLEPFEIGFRHFCTHPIMPYLEREVELTLWEGGYEEVYLRFQTKGEKR